MDPKPHKSMFDDVSPKLTFIFGVVIAIAAISSIGFYMLLSDNLNGVDGETKKTTKTTTNTNAKIAGETAPIPTAPAPSGTIAVEGLRHIRGEGKIIVVEFSDTECPFCKRFHPTMQQVMTDYDGKVRWAYKHFPLQSLHRKARREAEATECAGDQDKFWEYTDEIFERTPSNDGLEDSVLFTIADDLGLNRSDFDACLENGKYTDIVQADATEAQAAGGTGTPYSLVIDSDGNILQPINGALPYEQVASVLDSVLSK